MRDESFATSCQAALHGCLPADKPQKQSIAARRSRTAASSSYRKQTRCVTRVFLRVAATRIVSHLKGETHGTRKTRHQAPGTAQEVPQEDQRLFPHQKQAVPVRTGSGQSRGSLCQARPSREKAAVPPPVDSARRRRRALERLDLRPADSRPEGC